MITGQVSSFERVRLIVVKFELRRGFARLFPFDQAITIRADGSANVRAPRG